MNYRHIYLEIIKHAKQEEINHNRDFGYYEKHHIFPKSLFPLWKNKKSNIVKLTAREHLFCHMLLTKIYPKSHEMWSALWYMSSKSKKKDSKYPKLTTREYERIKINYAKSNSLHLKGKKNPNMARVISSETKLLLSKKSKGNTNVRGKCWWTKDGKSTFAVDCPGEGWVKGRNTKGKDAWNKGKPMSVEQKEKLSKVVKEKVAKMTKEERSAKFGTMKGKTPWNKGVNIKIKGDYK